MRSRALSEAEERAAWELWRWLGSGEPGTAAELEAALRILREAGWTRGDFGRVLEMGRAPAARSHGKRRGGVWLAAAELRRALREVGEG